MNSADLKKITKEYEEIAKRVNLLRGYSKDIPPKYQKSFIQSISAINDSLEIFEDTLVDIRISEE